jgi:hypothetical protein
MKIIYEYPSDSDTSTERLRRLLEFLQEQAFTTLMAAHSHWRGRTNAGVLAVLAEVHIGEETVLPLLMTHDGQNLLCACCRKLYSRGDND